ncbi:hypothetical protein QNO21_00810 [Microbacterium sp. zg-Y818]|uniref:hypothetical protein n=1 Tax=unclassified Microbacterium TaxID=2609290 RepID=UPI00214CF09D|nr:MULTISPECIES: hypothetical protein [unclassified Microbacterium]MCR2802063.1 hypothetical protein [Microbacterium sp. zg.Y818]WIM22612.1 hypothetical protein QNO21_00810 [Microbacterium sp. zg-Y818]
MYVRFQSPRPGKRGVHTGIFGLANGLARGGHLTAEEHADWRAGNEWYNAAYADPTDADVGVYDESLNPQAAAWFKGTASHLLERIPRYLEILHAHGVECCRVEADDPGRIIYEDEVQIVVVPHDAPRI